MGGCNCFEKRIEEDNEVNNGDNEIKSISEQEIENPFNPEEYENVLITEKKEAEEELTNLDSEIQEKENNNFKKLCKQNIR